MCNILLAGAAIFPYDAPIHSTEKVYDDFEFRDAP